VSECVGGGWIFAMRAERGEKLLAARLQEADPA
jgi:hypothetical protein